MPEQLFELAHIAKYIIIGLGVIGLIALIIGLYRRDRSLLTRGGYMLILAIVIWVCGYFIYTTTLKNANQKFFYTPSQY